MKTQVLASILSTFALTAFPQSIDYRRDIQPILAEHCFHCHGKDESARQGDLRLDLRDSAIATSILPGKPEESSLYQRITSKDDDLVMPPPHEKKPLRTTEIETLRQWIQEGAPYAEHWAFIPPIKHPLPGIETAGSGISTSVAIDAFVADRLKKEGLQFAEAAPPEILCRRLHLDLLGLPPSPREVDEFLEAVHNAGRQTAVNEKVDRLLKDRRFGEKWARHWLDVARYSDSNGFEKDFPREMWIWRDWVIQAIQADMPYDQFIIEQLAGDLLPDRTQQQLIATGFLRNSMINEEGAIVPEEWRMEAMFDRMDTIGSGVLGLSLKCAQCHTHKFDPIDHTEYYGLFAFINNTYDAQSWVYTDQQLEEIAKIRQGIAAVDARLKKQHSDWADQLALWENETLQRWQAATWSVVKALDTHSSAELNHPEILPDQSILTLGHRTVQGDVHIIAEPIVENVTGILLEILQHDDLPFGGPGRSYKGSWALTELNVEAMKPESTKWEKLKLVNASCDFEEPLAGMELEWTNKSRDKDNRRMRGPVSFMIDGDDRTAWRADRGAGRRHSASVAAAQFEAPLTLPKGTKLRIGLVTNHGGDDNGPKNTQVGRFRVSLTQSTNPTLPKIPYEAILALQSPLTERSEKQRLAIFEAWREATPAMKTFHDEVEKLWQAFPREGKTTVLHLAERTPADQRITRRLERGVWNQGREPIEPKGIAALHPLVVEGSHHPPRLDFAKWLVDRRSPLTARVAVNRIWNTIFGTGLVETTEDFGTRAPDPSHPELLDWLAVDFMEQGWSQKKLIRSLVTSQTYAQSSQGTLQLLERDPRNRLLARGPRFRAEAEVVRDLVLSAAGLLSDKYGGPSIFPPMPASVIEFNFVKPDYWRPPEDFTRYSRALYLFRKRSMPDPTMIVLDAPTGDTTCTRRPRSNSPLAALTTLNEPIFVEAAQAMALRVLHEGGENDASRIDYAFRLCTSRSPTDEERTELSRLLDSRRARLKEKLLSARDLAFSPLTKPADLPAEATPNEIAAWAIVSRVLLNLDEAITK